VKTGGFHAWKKSWRTFSTASERALEKQLGDFLLERIMPRCPVCDATVSLDTTPTAPFCSERCRLVDLGRWLDEAYALPERRGPGADDGEGDDEAVERGRGEAEADDEA
jgi:uncharacterized protein